MINFWKGKKVFITGHTGFKGSWLSLWLQQLQAEVVGFALSPTLPINLFDEANVSDGMVDIRGDIRDYIQLSQAIHQHQPEFIFHLAAQPLVLYSYNHPIETYATNVLGTVHLLEAARHCDSVRVIVNVTTDKCYENKETGQSYKESDPMGGYDPYSSSKGCSELVTSAYRNSYFFSGKVGLATARAGNVIGGGDWSSDRLIPDVISACKKNQSLSVRYPEAIRPWQHVLESLSGYLHLAQQLFHEPRKYAEAWNCGPHQTNDKTVSWIIDEISNLWGAPITLQTLADKEHEAKYLRLDCTKTNSKLGWQPKWDIQETLQATVDWYKAFYNSTDAKTITLAQINQYMTTTKEIFP